MEFIPYFALFGKFNAPDLRKPKIFHGMLLTFDVNGRLP